MVRHHWFIRLRWIITLATLAILVLERLKTPEFLRPHALMACIIVLGLVNLLWTILGRILGKELHGEDAVALPTIRNVVRFANAQMTVDLLLLTLILRFSGGIENPMSVFYLFHMLIAALLLRPLNAFLQGSWALLLYSGLVMGECSGLITPHYPFLASMADLQMHADWGLVLAGVGVLAAGIFGALYFTLQISLRLDEQERELQEANEALRRSQAAIGDLQARRSRFMQTAAHQLKSPLAGIETLAGLIRDKVVSPDAVSGIIARIIARCQQAIVHITELLTLARLAGAASVRQGPVRTDIRELVDQVVGRFSEQATGKGLTLEVDTGDRDAVSKAVDARDLDDCLSNLVDNAIKYTPEGGTIRVTVTGDSDAISISVKDSGMGIAEDCADDIFDPFRRGNLALAANVPGSGLGLAIVREVVEQANGRITVHSAVGEGSEFIVLLPKERRQAASEAVRPTKVTTLHVRPSTVKVSGDGE
jgi:signal transduction histidine kinase